VQPIEVADSERVLVTFTIGVTSPPNASLDFVAVYTPPDADPATVAPVRVLRCADDPAYAVHGSGALAFRPLNLRGDYALVLIRGYDWSPSKFTGWPPTPYALTGASSRRSPLPDRCDFVCLTL
jgi:hypothetical protein